MPATGTMEDVTKALAKHYTPESKENSWFGHPARLTVKGRPVDDGKSADGA